MVTALVKLESFVLEDLHKNIHYSYMRGTVWDITLHRKSVGYAGQQRAM